MSEKIKISYGDREYSLSFDGGLLERTKLKDVVRSFVFTALREFHKVNHEDDDYLFGLKEALHKLYVDYPDAQGFIMKALNGRR